MKLKLAQNVMSRAKRLFHLDGKVYEKAGVLIRHAALRAAIRSSKTGSNTDVQCHKSLKEFLAFFSVIVVNEMAMNSGRQSEEELKGVYQQVVKATCEAAEPDPTLLDHQLTVNRLITYKKSGFDHWFYGYWNADFEGMRITDAELAELTEKGIPGPSGNACADAGLILLIRVARLEDVQLKIPSPEQIWKYDAVIQEEVTGFVRSLKEILA
ncbi:MAG: hypothetical protein U1G07_01320 [Verrucomicrobiota bacterium]